MSKPAEATQWELRTFNDTLKHNLEYRQSLTPDAPSHNLDTSNTFDKLRFLRSELMAEKTQEFYKSFVRYIEQYYKPEDCGGANNKCGYYSLDCLHHIAQENKAKFTKNNVAKANSLQATLCKHMETKKKEFNFDITPVLREECAKDALGNFIPTKKEIDYPFFKAAADLWNVLIVVVVYYNNGSKSITSYAPIDTIPEKVYIIKNTVAHNVALIWRGLTWQKPWDIRQYPKNDPDSKLAMLFKDGGFKNDTLLAILNSFVDKTLTKAELRQVEALGDAAKKETNVPAVWKTVYYKFSSTPLDYTLIDFREYLETLPRTENIKECIELCKKHTNREVWYPRTRIVIPISK